MKMMSLLALIAIILAGGWAYGKQQEKIAKRVADELERRQQEKD